MWSGFDIYFQNLEEDEACVRALECLEVFGTQPSSQPGLDHVLGSLCEQDQGFGLPSTKHVFRRFWSADIIKNGLLGPTGITRKKFWMHPRKGTIMRLVKNAKTGKYENVYEEV